ncbi:MAG: AIR synthase-related protein [Candidatus Njordarchaeum guaymaensis]
MKKLTQGKLPPNLLRKIIKEYIGIVDKKVLVGPEVGFDSAIIQITDDKIVVTTDPALFIPREIPIEMFAFGLVHFAGSDIAVFGAKPKWMIYNLLFPPYTDSSFILDIAKAVDKECKKWNISIIGGHTGVYSGIKIPIGTTTMIGELISDRPILPSGAKPGDSIILTKWLGLEFLVALSYSKPNLIENLLGKKGLEKYRTLYTMQTTIPEAMLLTKELKPHAMHDVTEGGLAAALNEMADSSNVDFIIREENLPISTDLDKVFSELKIDPLKVSSTGSLLISIEKEKTDDIISLLSRSGIHASIIGEFKKKGTGRFLEIEGKVLPFPEPGTDFFADFFVISNNKKV